MPTYEYRCEFCLHTFEVFQSFSEAPIEECPKCGKRVKRVFHPVGIVLKGSGFYSTDNRSGGALKPEERKASTGSSDGKAETETTAARAEKS